MNQRRNILRCEPYGSMLEVLAEGVPCSNHDFSGAFCCLPKSCVRASALAMALAGILALICVGCVIPQDRQPRRWNEEWTYVLGELTASREELFGGVREGEFSGAFYVTVQKEADPNVCVREILQPLEKAFAYRLPLNEGEEGYVYGATWGEPFTAVREAEIEFLGRTLLLARQHCGYVIAMALKLEDDEDLSLRMLVWYYDKEGTRESEKFVRLDKKPVKLGQRITLFRREDIHGEED